MSSATSAVTYTSVYTDSEPGRAFWGADDEEVSEGGIPRVIVLGYDGLPIQPVAPPSPDYIPGPEDPQTPPIPQDEDEHEFPAEEQPLPPVDSPTAESPGHVTESDPEEDPEEYEDDEIEDGPVDYPMDGGDDGDDDDGDSSRDDANDEDEDDEDEEEEEHIAPADSTIVAPVDEPVFPPEGTEPVIPPPSTDITIGARITESALLATTQGGVLSTLGSRYEVGESSTARPTRGQGIDYGFVSTVDAEERRQGIRGVGYGIRGTWVDLAGSLEISTYRPWESSILGSTELLELHGMIHRTCNALLEDLRIAELAALRETDRRRQDQMVETFRVIRDMRREMSDMQAELLTLREQQRRARQPRPETRIPDHRDAFGDTDSHM
ncbi:hypothetical protein Tco_0830763 [Tanacetum coccineum]